MMVLVRVISEVRLAAFCKEHEQNVKAPGPSLWKIIFRDF